jgi:hypothetical protein
MRRLGAICLALGLAAPALAADPPAAEDTSVPWYRWLFLGERSKPTPTTPPPPVAGATRPTQPAQAAPVTKEALARMVAEEQRIYLERLRAISRIRELANELNDETLMRKADELEVQAEELYRLRTAKLPGLGENRDDRAALERGRDSRPATAERPASRRPSTRGGDR